MSERWTSPKAGPFPSGHLVVKVFEQEPYPLPFVDVRCGRPQPQVTTVQRLAFTPEPPPTSGGRTCETCLRLANRDSRSYMLEDKEPVE